MDLSNNQASAAPPNVDMALDDITKKRRSQRQANRRRRAGATAGGRRPGAKPGSTVGKSRGGLRSVGNSFRTTGALVADATGSKILVSNLHFGVTESDLRELFEMVGPLKKVSLAYDKNGRSKGSAEVIFVRKNDATRAVNKYKGVALDGRKIMIEVVANLDRVTAAARSISSRIAASSATPTKKAGAGGRGGARSRGARRGRGGRRGGRRGPAAGSNKTAEQLDAEMDTYMGESSQAQAGAADASMGA